MTDRTRRIWRHYARYFFALLIVLSAPPHALANPLAEEVRAAEQAFADSMAQRDFDAFRSFLAEEAVFFSSDGPDRGREAVAARWAAYFEHEAAPFSWAPGQVEVLSSGDLAFSSGPVHDEAGRHIATFHSVWRREGDGRWRVVFDKGARWCAPPETH
jgi:ketosteroid isomerase-like protein